MTEEVVANNGEDCGLLLAMRPITIVKPKLLEQCSNGGDKAMEAAFNWLASWIKRVEGTRGAKSEVQKGDKARVMTLQERNGANWRGKSHTRQR